MNEQLELSDVFPDIMPKPTLWECMKTCEHCGKIMDHFPGSTRERCLYGYTQDPVHSTKAVLDKRGIWRVYCKYYKRRTL